MATWVLRSTATDYDDHTNPPVIIETEDGLPPESLEGGQDEWEPATDEQYAAYEAYWDAWYVAHDPSNA